MCPASFSHHGALNSHRRIHNKRETSKVTSIAELSDQSDASDTSFITSESVTPERKRRFSQIERKLIQYNLY